MLLLQDLEHSPPLVRPVRALSRSGSGRARPSVFLLDRKTHLKRKNFFAAFQRPPSPAIGSPTSYGTGMIRPTLRRMDNSGQRGASPPLHPPSAATLQFCSFVFRTFHISGPLLFLRSDWALKTLFS